MTEIGKIIQSVLEDVDTLPIGEAEDIAAQCEQKLLAATMVQLAVLLGGDVKRDDEGHAVICTSIQMEEDRLSLCNIPLHFSE
jgi:hypothetical protein